MTFRVYWQSDRGFEAILEEQVDFESLSAAHDYIGEQPDGGYYSIREVEKKVCNE
jgi:hypothetical protein